MGSPIIMRSNLGHYATKYNYSTTPLMHPPPKSFPGYNVTEAQPQ